MGAETVIILRWSSITVSIHDIVLLQRYIILGISVYAMAYAMQLITYMYALHSSNLHWCLSVISRVNNIDDLL